MTRRTGYIHRLLMAVTGRDVLADEAPESDDATKLKAAVAALHLDLQEQEDRIAAMRKEYEQLQASKEQSTASAGEEELTSLMKKLSGPLSNIAVLRDAAAAGEDVQVDDLLRLIASLEKVLQRAGLEVIGHSGEASDFDPAIHQRMSGGSVHEGVAVKIEVPGYRLGERVLQKALVSVEGNGDGENNG